ncbi:MAG: phosphatase PAP2 family protein [Candidatus Kapabacteria bacterium]|nr:phosphatase PAP2 family protein [Candidatus Kapabacteria bacterium]
MILITQLKNKLTMSDIYTLFMLILYTLLALIFYNSLDTPLLLTVTNVAIVSFVIYISMITERFKKNKNFLLFRRVYIAPIIFVIYSQIHNYIPLVNPELYDLTLIKWDYAIFGVNPTEWIYRISNPVLTEYLQFSYMLYFVMPIAHGVELHFRRKDAELDYFTRNVLFAFYLSYLLYFFMPAIGPRFFIHDFATLSNELPGIWLTEFFRSIVNNGGGIPIGVGNPAEYVNRDCMPSGHTMITLVNVYLVFKNKSKFRIPIFIFSMSLIFATIYLRYHYAVDVFAGILFAYISIRVEPFIRNLVKNKLKYKSV